MAAFMNQLTMLDPTTDPRVTSQEFRNSLPRKYAISLCLECYVDLQAVANSRERTE